MSLIQDSGLHLIKHFFFLNLFFILSLSQQWEWDFSLYSDFSRENAEFYKQQGFWRKHQKNQVVFQHALKDDCL